LALIDEQAKKRGWQVWRHRRRSALEFGQQADQQLEKLLIRRFDRLMQVRRFVFLWLLLFILLIFCTVIQLRALSPYYQSLRPVPGGIYSEGIIGTFTNANPLYSVGTANVAASRLVFSGLLRYSDNNVLTTDLASDWGISGAPTHYVVHLKRDIVWHDGKPFTADDVVFTYHLIQNIEAQSTLYVAWKDIKVSKKDTYTITFDLPNALSSFPYALTNGIVPQHLLKDIPPQDMRSASFNTAPVGTGPFEWKFIDVTGNGTPQRQQRISLAANGRYWNGRPQLDGFNLITFTDEQHLISTFKQKQLNAMSGLESLPDEMAGDTSVQTYPTPLTSAVMAFFNNSQPVLHDPLVRRALVAGTDRSQLPNLFKYPVRLADGPLLRGQLGYDPSVVEPAYDAAKANQLLDQAGWPRGQDGYRAKNSQPLQFNMTSQDTANYATTAQFLQQQWAKLGVKVLIHYYSGEDLQSTIIANHDYDILVYGINIGVDPDVFAYWDSSQASISSPGHLNLSEYKSTAADQALEAGRTRSDKNARVPKYKIFLTNWVQDAPALALYQPNYLYITRGPVFNYQRKADNGVADRFYNVNDWMVRQQHQTI